MTLSSIRTSPAGWNSKPAVIEPTPDPSHTPAMSSIARLWSGDLALPDAFWIWAVLGGLLVNVVTSGLFVGFMLADRPLPAVLFGYGISLPYNLLATIGVWRSADRYEGDRRVAEFMRLATAVGMLLLSIT